MRRLSLVSGLRPNDLVLGLRPNSLFLGLRPRLGLPLPLLLAGLTLAACGGEERPSPSGGGRVAPDDVASVDGVGITREALADYALRTGTSPRTALEELVTLEVLYGEARRRGLEPGDDERAEMRRAAVRALLHRDFEASRQRQHLPMELLRTTYEQRKAYFVRPPVRRVHNLLFRETPPSPTSPGLATLRTLVAEARRAGLTPDAILARARELGLKVDLDLSTFAGDPRFVGKWVEAVTKGPFEPGALSEPFATPEFGWHVVVFLEELPARNTPFDEAVPELRDRLLVPYREKELAPWLARLMDRHRVIKRPELLQPELSQPEPQREDRAPP